MALVFSSDELLFLGEENTFCHSPENNVNITSQKEIAPGKTVHRTPEPAWSGPPGATYSSQGHSRITWKEHWPKNQEMWLPGPACL
jgi:hypothetical protein